MQAGLETCQCGVWCKGAWACSSCAVFWIAEHMQGYSPSYCPLKFRMDTSQKIHNRHGPLQFILLLPLLSMPFSAWKCTSHFCLNKALNIGVEILLDMVWLDVMPQLCCSLEISITVVSWVIGRNLECFWFLHLATILIPLKLFFCKRRKKKKKAFHFSGFLWVGGFSLSAREVGVRVPIDQWSMQYKASKTVLPSVWEQTAGGRRLARKCLAASFVGAGALRQFVLWFACFWAASVKLTEAYRQPNDWELPAHPYLVLVHQFMSSFCQNLSAPHVCKVQ